MIPPVLWLVLATWLGLGLMLIGIGSLVGRLCRAPAVGAEGLLRMLWLGWAVLLVLLQLWYLLRPVNGRAVPAFALLGALGLVAGGVRPWLVVLRGLRRNWLPVLALALFAVSLSNRALVGPRFGDTGLYHVPKLRWIVEYPIVPGLGNLYIALAHNQTSFLYVALLDGGPFTRCPYQVANGVLVLALAARVLLGMARLLRRHASTPVDVFYALCLPVVVGFGYSIFLTCPTPDMAVSMLGIVLSGEILRVLSRTRARPAPDFDLLVLAVLAVEAVTVKLSVAGLALTGLALALAHWLWSERATRSGTLRTTVALATIVVFCGGLWMVGNVILSGYALYPTPYGAMPVEWRLRFDMAEWVDAIRLGAPLSYAWRDPRWFITRLQSLGWGTADDLVPAAVAAVAMAAMLASLPMRVVRRGVRRVPLVVLVPTIASLLFTLANAPTPRYAGSTLWLLAVQPALLALGGAAFGFRRPGRVLALAAAVLISLIPVVSDPPLWMPLREFQIVAPARVTPMQLETGLMVQVPITDTGLCGDAPLPCTPHPHPALRLRRAGDLSSGFMMDPVLFEEHKDTKWHARAPVVPGAPVG